MSMYPVAWQVSSGGLTQPIAWHCRTYTPKPINTHGVDLSPELLALVELLARNVHEVWAAGKLAAKWKYMPERAVADLPAGAAGAGNTSSMLVPYEFLTEKVRDACRT